MDKRLWTVLLAGAAAVLVACAGMLVPEQKASEPAAPERLFFAMQIERQGAVIARPNLLGVTGMPLSMRLVEPGRPDHANLSLKLQPSREGTGYRVHIDLELDDRDGVSRGDLTLMHGEERRLLLSQNDRPIGVRMMLMRVDSPEFEAYMGLARKRLERRTS